MEQARHLYGVAVAEMWPKVGVDVGYSYETNKYNGGELKKDPEHDLKLPITWEVNLWGSMIHAKDADESALCGLGGGLPRNAHDGDSRGGNGLFQAAVARKRA